MKRLLFVFAAFVAAGLAAAVAPAIPASVQKLEIIYDNTVADPAFGPDWGFAVLVTGFEKTILFDTGTKADLFLANAGRLKVDFGAVDVVVISHDHGDHTGGLAAALPKMKNPLLLLPLPAAAIRSTSLPPGQKLECREKGSAICDGAWLTGIIGKDIREQGLILDTGRGSVLITGCAHPGIVEMVQQANLTRGRPMDVVLGGFHLMNHTAAQVEAIISRFRELGVKKVGATHCTGEASIALFRKAFGRDFVELGAGRTIVLGDLIP